MIGISNQVDKCSIKEAVSKNGRPDYLNRYQLLTYNQVERLSAVMETYVPIHGTGNFPTLDICPSMLVQEVKKRVEEIGIKVTSVRLNGSAATHVLSENAVPTYKDLDLIFQIENGQQAYAATHKHQSATTMLKPKLEKHFESNDDCVVDGIARRPTYLTKQRSQSEDTVSVIEDSGYASSESISSYPPSPSEPTLPELNCIKDAHHTPSTSKLLSEEDLRSLTVKCNNTLPSCHSLPPYLSYSSYRTGRDDCWEHIKDAVMNTLLDYLPPKVSRERMCSSMLASAYVQKKVKVNNERDKWSLISLNNNTGRNLELKFVQSMHRQYEFSVDSFQIELASFLEFRRASRSSTLAQNTVEMKESFYPTVVAESVYGDFAAAQRHLRHRRICTYRPEEIRGGGLLRYCNLRVRGYRPGDCDERGRDLKATSNDSNVFTSDVESVARLEQHMCSRFFIDFGSIQYQSKKLVSYLENRFAGEDDLKLEYLIMLRSVVGSRTVCLMQHELKLILDHITHMVRQTLANNIARSNGIPSTPAAAGYCGEYYPPSPYSYPQYHHHPHPHHHQIIDQDLYYHPHPSNHCYLATTTLLPPPPSDRSSPMSVQSISCGDHQSARSSPEPYSRPPSAPPSSIEGYYPSMAPPTSSVVAAAPHMVATSNHYHHYQACNIATTTCGHTSGQSSSGCVCACYCGCFCCSSPAAVCPPSFSGAYMPFQPHHRFSRTPPPPHHQHHQAAAAIVVSSNTTTTTPSTTVEDQVAITTPTTSKAAKEVANS